MKFEMGSPMMVLTLIPESKKIIIIEWRSAPDTFSLFLQGAASPTYKIFSTRFFFLFLKVL
jgi:hypothetical protein